MGFMGRRCTQMEDLAIYGFHGKFVVTHRYILEASGHVSGFLAFSHDQIEVGAKAERDIQVGAQSPEASEQAIIRRSCGSLLTSKY